MLPTDGAVREVEVCRRCGGPQYEVFSGADSYWHDGRHGRNLERCIEYLAAEIRELRRKVRRPIKRVVLD
jgi:hypothetical protein